MNGQDDDNLNVVLGGVIAAVAVVLALVFGVALYKGGAPKAVPAPAEAASAPAATGDEASVKVENGVVKFYFATGKADVAANGAQALVDIVTAVAAGKKVVISGFHDATGDPAKNAELAKQRALAVRDALKALGVAEDKVELKKPEQMEGTGSNAEARRVEVAVQ